VVAPSTENAAENGAGFYLLGARGPMAGLLAPPGTYFQNDTYFYVGESSFRSAARSSAKSTRP